MSQVVQAEMVALLYQHTPSAIIGTAVAVLIIWILFAGMIPIHILIIWSTAIVGALFWRYLLYARFQRTLKSSIEAGDWERLSMIGAGVTGHCLGVGGVVIASYVSPFYQGAILLLILGITVSAIPFLGAVRKVYFSYSVGTSLPIAAWCVQHWDPVYMSTAAMICVFIFAAWVTSTKYSHSIESVILAKHKLSEVTSAKNELQESYDKLATEQQYRAMLEEKIVYQASHDSLTGLVNRVEFDKSLQYAIESARTQKVGHALGYLDLDQFKIVNDTCGHAAGDELLRQIGKLLQDQMRKQDTLARLGGDEFGVVMENCTLQQARRVAEKVRRAVAAFRFAWEGQVFRLGVSIGLVPITEASEGVSNLLIAADSACYAAKDEGRNRVHVYHLDDIDLARRQGEMQWMARIDQALEDGRFQIWRQSIVPVTAGSDAGDQFELLLRLVDENGEIIRPGVFLPAAERYGLATKLDRWVISTALSSLQRDLDALRRLRMCFINLSSTSLADEEFLEFVCKQLDESEVPSEKICFEITETAAIANMSRAMVFMTTIKGIGCRFALDDFGSGLSSFEYLKKLPVDYLKIDGTFVKDILDEEVDLAFVRSINDVSKVMGKFTIAEFVESKMILEKLRELGVDYAQGYGICYPTPFGDADASLAASVA